MGRGWQWVVSGLGHVPMGTGGAWADLTRADQVIPHWPVSGHPPGRADMALRLGAQPWWADGGLMGGSARATPFEACGFSPWRQRWTRPGAGQAEGTQTVCHEQEARGWQMADWDEDSW